MSGSGRHRKGEDPPVASVLVGPGVEELREEIRVRAPSPLDRLTAAIVGGFVLLGSVVMAASNPGLAPHHVLTAVLLLGLYVIGFRTEFPAATGAFVATEPVLVAMLMVLPLHWVPMAVTLGVLIASHEGKAARNPLHNLLLRAGNAVHVFGPVLVLLALGQGDSLHADTGILLLALAAQFTVDGVTALIRGAVQGVPPRQMARPLLWTFSVDALLVPSASASWRRPRTGHRLISSSRRRSS